MDEKPSRTWDIWDGGYQGRRARPAVYFIGSRSPEALLCQHSLPLRMGRAVHLRRFERDPESNLPEGSRPAARLPRRRLVGGVPRLVPRRQKNTKKWRGSRSLPRLWADRLGGSTSGGRSPRRVLPALKGAPASPEDRSAQGCTHTSARRRVGIDWRGPSSQLAVPSPGRAMKREKRFRGSTTSWPVKPSSPLDARRAAGRLAVTELVRFAESGAVEPYRRRGRGGRRHLGLPPDEGR